MNGQKRYEIHFIHTYNRILPDHNLLKKEKSCNNTDKSEGYHAN